MFICVDFDGTIVKQDHAYEDLAHPLEFMPGARGALYALKSAGHTLILWSGRSRLALRKDPTLDPLVRAGVKPVRRDWYLRATLHEARYQQMVRFVQTNLPNVFAYIFEGGETDKPGADLFIDDRAIRLTDDHRGHSWITIAEQYGMPSAAKAREGMNYETFASKFLSLGAGSIGDTSVGPILRLDTRGEKGVAIIIAGQHGEEQAGCLALFDGIEEILSSARALGVGLAVFPCVNPEGFERVQRLNANNESPTNTALQYEIKSGQWVGELPTGVTPLRVRLVDRATIANETRRLLDSLDSLSPTRQHTVVLDLHQDVMLKAEQAYAYVFGKRRYYEFAMNVSAAKPLANTKLKNDSWTDVHIELETDENGLTEFTDGSITDLLWRRGGALVACLETAFPDMPTSVRIARRWIDAFILAAARKVSARV